MRKIVRFVLMSCIVCLLAGLSSCSPRMTPVHKLRNLSNHIARYGEYYAPYEWQEAGNKYIDINRRIMRHKSEYRPDELEEIMYLEGQCLANFGKGVVSGVANSFNSVKAMIDGVKNALKNP